LAAVSIQDLKPNSQDTSAFYLENIFQLLANPNVSRASILATSTKPPPFSPPKAAILVNSLWFLSLAISLTYALLATSLQHWARRYLSMTQLQRSSPHKRARIRAFFADGIDKFHLSWAIKALPTLLHASLILFFAGLLIFLFNINHVVFRVVISWVGLSAGIYVYHTVLPMFRSDSLSYTPLSLPLWFLYTALPYGVFRILYIITDCRCFGDAIWARFYRLRRTFRRRFVGGIGMVAQEIASRRSAEIDVRILTGTFNTLEEDYELEQFFACIPGFCNSAVVDEPQMILRTLDHGLGNALDAFLSRTLTSNLLFETDKERRLIVWLEAVDALGHPFFYPNFRRVFMWVMDGSSRSVQMGHMMRSQCSNLYAQGIVAGIIARTLERDDDWIALVKDQLDVSEDVLQDYLAHSNSMLLANVIHTTRQFFRSYLGGDQHAAGALQYMLPSISAFDVRSTLPGLQHDFCTLWNEIALEARNSQSSLSCLTLRSIRHLYIDLHQGTDAAPTAFDASTADDNPILLNSSSYPLCEIPAHRPHMHEAADGATYATIHPPTITSPTLLPPGAILDTTTFSAVPDLPHVDPIS
jgi:hypothetical protein